MNLAQTIPLADAWGMHGDVGAGWMVLMMALMVLFWGAIIFGVVWLIRGATRREAPLDGAAGSKESPVEILERRFAEGAITPEDYRGRREVLVGARSDTEGRAQ
jgi:putative membrane protein